MSITLPDQEVTPSTPGRSCPHTPTCPPFNSPDHDSAVVIAPHPEQGWWLLCNGVVVQEDTGEILPNGQVFLPHRPEPRHRANG